MSNIANIYLSLEIIKTNVFYLYEILLTIFNYYLEQNTKKHKLKLKYKICIIVLFNNKRKNLNEHLL